MCTHKKNKQMYVLSVPLYRGWKLLNVKIERLKKKNVYITILLFTGTLRSSLNTKMFYLNI